MPRMTAENIGNSIDILGHVKLPAMWYCISREGIMLMFDLSKSW